MSNAAVSESVAPASNRPNQTLWLALTLTAGLGPTRAKRLVEFFGGVEGVFRASLTELEAAGLPAGAAQSLATGRSIELAQDELGKAAGAGVRIVSLDDPSILRSCGKSTILRCCFTFAGMWPRFLNRESPWLEPGTQPRMEWEWRSDWLVIWLPAIW